jgi:hypothetical protein
MTKTRCKFRCESKVPAWEGSTDHFKVSFQTLYDTSIPEDERFSKYTPSGQMEVTISNPAALEMIQPGQDYYIDISPASSAPAGE